MCVGQDSGFRRQANPLSYCECVCVCTGLRWAGSSRRMRSSRRTACGQEQEQEQEQALAGQVRTFQVPDSQGGRRQAQSPESACLALLSLPPSPSLPLRLQGDWSSKRYDLLLLVGRTHRTSHHCPRRHLPIVLCFKLLVSQHADIPSLFSLTIHSLKQHRRRRHDHHRTTPNSCLHPPAD